MLVNFQDMREMPAKIMMAKCLKELWKISKAETYLHYGTSDFVEFF